MENNKTERGKKEKYKSFKKNVRETERERKENGPRRASLCELIREKNLDQLFFFKVLFSDSLAIDPS
ncbi:unnamed protein product [Lactuca virosa]|uniref:Uncharacterized protein n=1 Tax=Lactuca virosa TaxID=75947 RepID=A0AAU9NWM5_9ASTR|nr:unnamed protein product [Lactuca virosa]